MRTHARFLFAAAGFALSAMLATACDGLLDFNHRNLTTVDQPPPPTPDPGPTMPVPPQRDASADEVAPPVRTCPAVMVDPSIDYVAMCRHYCDTLEETQRYVSLSRGEAPADAGTTSAQCYELRCVPRCVDQALCLTQCGAAGMYYTAVCADADAGADNAVCPASPDDHLNACRAGCSPPAAPILPVD
ncbi:MAG TPA: hypothetical protein VIF57_29740 [Polyangia bacterium]|jgi:hypothetical protein